MNNGGWRTIKQNHLYRNPWCAFRVDEVRLPNGTEIDYGVLESGGFAAVAAITESGGVLLVRQYRQPLGRHTLELPSGGVDGEENPRSAAARELFEETGYEAEDLEHLISVHTSTGRSTEICHLFRCRAVESPEGPQPEETEFIEVVEMPLHEALKKVWEGGITDAATALGLLLAGNGCGPGKDKVK